MSSDKYHSLNKHNLHNHSFTYILKKITLKLGLHTFLIWINFSVLSLIVFYFIQINFYLFFTIIYVENTFNGKINLFR